MQGGDIISNRQQIEYLQSLIADDIIDSSEGKEKIYMLKEKAVKEVHNRAICQRSNGRYATKVEVDEKLKQITASTYEELIAKLYDYYFGISNATFEMLYPQWVEYRKNESSVKDKTIKENGYIWNAHLKGQAITKKPIRNLRPIDYIAFFRALTKGRTMTRKRFNDMKSILNGILYYAIEKDIVSHNPLNDINYQQFNYKVENVADIPYTEQERYMMLAHIPEDDLYALAIKLAFYLVLRIGELKGLRFDDIQGNFICIQRFVNDKNVIEEDIKGHTSLGKRWLPLTIEALRIIEAIRKLNPDSEYLFMRDGKPLATCTFNRRLKKYCNELGIKYRSSHQIRFGNASSLHKNGLSVPEIQNMLGHTTPQMTHHYLRNVVGMEQTYAKVQSIFG